MSSRPNSTLILHFFLKNKECFFSLIFFFYQNSCFYIVIEKYLEYRIPLTLNWLPSILLKCKQSLIFFLYTYKHPYQFIETLYYRKYLLISFFLSRSNSCVFLTRICNAVDLILYHID